MAAFLALTNVSLGDGSPKCSLVRLSACSTTNALVWDRQFSRALAAFASGARTNFFDRRNASLVDDLFAVLGGPPDAPRRLSDGSYLFTACRAHDCPQKGAVILSERGDIHAAAMITEKSRKTKDDLIFHLSFDVFVRNDRLSPVWRSALEQWANAASEEWLESSRRYKIRTAGMQRHMWLITSTGKLRSVKK